MTAPPGRETRRQGPAGRNLDDGEVTSSEFTVTPTNLIIRRKRWAYALVRRASVPFPLYGTEEWLTLPLDSAERIASVVRAAECWAQEGDNLMDNLDRELDERWRMWKSYEDADFTASAERHRERWGHLRLIPPYDERRAAEVAAAVRRPGDFRGRNHVGGGPDVGQPVESDPR